MTDLLDRECGFCGQLVDDGEDLEPVFVGRSPTPGPQVLRGLAEHPTQGGLSDIRIRGHSVGEFLALLDALKTADGTDVEMCKRVRMVENVEFGEVPPDVPAKVDTEIDEGKAAATVTIEPSFDEPAADLHVCEHCAANLRQDS